MRILGIDPGTYATGWGIIDCEPGSAKAVAWGAIRAPRSAKFPERLCRMADGLKSVIAEHSPKVASLEEAFYGSSVQSALRIGEARGAVIVACRAAGLEIEQFSPAQVKKSVTSHGAAHKSQVAEMVRRLLNLDEPPAPEDAADALAVALTLCHRL